MKLIQTIFLGLIIVSITALSGCFDGIMNDENYNKYAIGVNAYTENNSYFYSNKILNNDVEFDKEIQQKHYEKFEITIHKSCVICGVLFIVKFDNGCQTQVTIYNNDTLVTTKNFEFSSNRLSEVSIFFSNENFEKNSILTIKFNDNLCYIENQFVFDCVVLAFGE